MQHKLVIGTHNPGKVREMQAALAAYFSQVYSLSDLNIHQELAETGTTFYENALQKALQVQALCPGYAVLTDDSGICVDALGGAPGVFSARYAGPHATDADNNRKLIEELVNTPQEKRTAAYQCELVLLLPGQWEPICAQGHCTGVLLDAPAGENGFGYDPYFYVASIGKTFAQASFEEKHELSHRGQALRALAKQLDDMA